MLSGSRIKDEARRVLIPPQGSHALIILQSQLHQWGLHNHFRQSGRPPRACAHFCQIFEITTGVRGNSPVEDFVVLMSFSYPFSFAQTSGGAERQRRDELHPNSLHWT